MRVAGVVEYGRNRDTEELVRVVHDLLVFQRCGEAQVCDMHALGRGGDFDEAREYRVCGGVDTGWRINVRRYLLALSWAKRERTRTQFHGCVICRKRHRPIGSENSTLDRQSQHEGT